MTVAEIRGVHDEDGNSPPITNQIQRMVTRGVEFLVIAAIDNAALGPVLARAKDRGVTIIAYDRLIVETPDLDYYASFDGYEVGALQALHIMEQLDLDNSNQTFNIEMFSGSPDDTNSEFFFVGALDMMERHLASGRLVVRSGESEQYLTSTERWSGSPDGPSRP
jgi:putative multiple sugar transport system substrate-binding protein